MPVSVACESSATVNAALRESLGGGGYAAAAAASVGDDTKAGGLASSVTAANGGANGGSSDGGDSFQDKLVASAKRVLLTKVDYEEAHNYGHTVLETLKSKYYVLKPNTVNGAGAAANENGAGATGNGNGNIPNGDGGGGGGGGNTKRDNTGIAAAHQLPKPKHVLYPREKILVGWKATSRKWQIGSGLINVGNTCYLNSTLQALFHVPSIAHWLLSETQHADSCKGADAGCIICSMIKTLQQTQCPNQVSIRPYSVYTKLKSICKHLVMGRQEDAHEFLRYLIESMERQYLARCANIKDLDPYSKETTPINQILGGYLKTSVNCLSCSHTSVTFQHFQDMLLDIRRADSIEDALDGYFSLERLEHMGYKCEACKSRVSATKQFSLERAPVVLCIQLKRFTILGTKISKQIYIKPIIDMGRFASHPERPGTLTYRLVSMISHLGSSQHCGHYTAVGLSESGVYYNFDDSYVQPLSMPVVTNTNAYVIFYELVNMPKASSAASNKLGLKYLNESKENHSELNGANQRKRSISPLQQRTIGPQLPLGGLPNGNAAASTATTNTTTSGSGSKSSASAFGPGPGHKLKAVPTSTTPNSKLVIKYKNETNTGNGVASTKQPMNGVHEPEPPQAPFIGPVAPNSFASNLTNGSANNHMTAGGLAADLDCSSSSESEDSANKSPRMPDMPNLFECSGGGGNEATTPTVNGGVGPTATPKKSSRPIGPSKSLVPYLTESEDDDESSGSEAETPRLAAAKTPKKELTTNPSAATLVNGRSHSPPPLCNGHEGGEASREPEKAGSKKTLKSVGKTSTNPIDSIFKKKSAEASKSDDESPTTTKRLARSADQMCGVKQRAAFKRSLSMSPTLPQVETATGIWKVTPLKGSQTSSSSVSSSNNTAKGNSLTAASSKSGNASASTTDEAVPKNLKNPFAASLKPAAATDSPSSKRIKFNGGDSAKNGYRPEVSTTATMSDSTMGPGSNGVVEELAKQSHRGYGAPVLTWGGCQTEIEQEVLKEAREQRQRDWNDEEELEMDRGRQKKVKQPKEEKHDIPTTPGYNAFQELQNSERRWKHTGGGSMWTHARHQNRGHFRGHNKYKFNRFQNAASSGGGAAGANGGGSTSHHAHKFIHRMQRNNRKDFS